MSLSSQKLAIHFVGIGGIGMSGLAELLLALGHRVTGSDLAESDSVRRLKGLNAQIQLGHSDDILKKFPANVVVYSTAVKSDNPEILWAHENQVPVIRRAEMLAELMRLKKGIAVAGSHGKTTTTGILSLLLRSGGQDPTVVIGGKFDAIGSNAAWGGGNWLVAEADESDGSFLKLSPELAIVTNIDREHMDHYGDFDSAKKSFLDFMDRIPFYGKLVLCMDCPILFSLKEKIPKPRLWYGMDETKNPDYLIKVIHQSPLPEFQLFRKTTAKAYELWLQAKLEVPGLHNVLNATAAVVCAAELGVDKKDILTGLSMFKGVRRRFEFKGFLDQHPVYEDYAHHPTEIKAVIAAALDRFPDQKPLVLFQPHRFTRTRDQWEEFSSCFAGAEQVFTLPIYAASELRMDWVEKFDGPEFAKNIKGEIAKHCSDRSVLAQELKMFCEQKTINAEAPIFVMGAGDIYKVLDLLNLKNPA